MKRKKTQINMENVHWSSHAIVHVMDGVESLSGKQSSIDG